MRLAIIGFVAAAGLALTVPAEADPHCRWTGYSWECGTGWNWHQQREWREHEYREHERWHEHSEWCEHHPYECRR